MKEQKMKPLFEQPIYVTRPLLPRLDNLQKKLEIIWNEKWLTNKGQMHDLLEDRLKQYLDVPHLSLLNNGTTALMVAYKCLGLTGEVITTPFTFSATPQSLTWCGLTPVFCDIDSKSLNIDPNKIEAQITENTSAILGVHVFGVPCDIQPIEEIARKYNLKVIYDGAHSFGIKVDDKGIGCFGDITMMSFHATKLFHTAEGGALLFKDEYLKKKADLYKNFGIVSESEVEEVGINGKMNEIQAALGLCTLELVDEEIEKRRRLTQTYKRILGELEGIEFIEVANDVEYNFQYLSLRIIQDRFGKSRDYIFSKLREHNIFARRYFYPLCSNFPFYQELPSAHRSNLSVAHIIESQILTLPLYGELEEEDVIKICELIYQMQKEA
jgi:dTDP-4-amino-4,6-dideoxygalactose transaminase